MSTTQSPTVAGLTRGHFPLLVPVLIVLQLTLLWSVEHALKADTDWVVDDAFISYRYAENWAIGQGLVFNPGERVEGYTNFLWVVILAVATRIGLDVVLVSQILGMALSGATLMLAVCFARLLFGNKEWSIFHLLPGLLLLVNLPYLVWSFGGMETHLYTFLFTLSLFLWVRGDRDELSAICFALTAMTRPEGALFAGVAVLLSGFDRYRHRNRGQHRVGRAALIFLVIFLPYFAWRFSYYGHLFPNTFYAKVGFGLGQIKRGGLYLGHFILQCGGLPLLAPIVAVFLFRKRRPEDFPARAHHLPLICLAYGAYLVYVGGDSLPALRLALPLVPLVYVLWAVSCQVWLMFITPGSIRRILAAVLITGSALLSAPVFHSRSILPELRGDKIALFGRKIGLYFQQEASPEETIATNTAGSIPFYARTSCIDMLGLCDEHIARRKDLVAGSSVVGHEKYDGLYVLSRAPEFIIFGNSMGTDGPSFVSDWDLVLLEPFPRFYKEKTARYDGYTFHYYEVEDRDSAAMHLSLGDEFFRKGIFDQAINQYLSVPDGRQPGDKIAIARDALNLRVGKAFDFESGDFTDWTVQGEAFGETPLKHMAPDQGPITLWQGRYFANSFALGSDQQRGILLSEPFDLVGEELTFLIAGTEDPEKCSVRLRVGEQVLFTAVGERSENFRLVCWDTRPYLGRTASLEIIDQSGSDWAHIMIDNVQQYSRPLRWEEGDPEADR